MVAQEPLEVTPVAADLTSSESDLRRVSPDGQVRLLSGVAGIGFLVSRFGQMIATEAIDPFQFDLLDKEDSTCNTDGDDFIEAVARDATGNRAKASMTVAVSN